MFRFLFCGSKSLTCLTILDCRDKLATVNASHLHFHVRLFYRSNRCSFFYLLHYFSRHVRLKECAVQTSTCDLTFNSRKSSNRSNKLADVVLHLTRFSNLCRKAKCRIYIHTSLLVLQKFLIERVCTFNILTTRHV